MVYLDTCHLKQLGVDWNLMINKIEDAVCAMAKKDFVQPVKPYLRFGKLSNRIIAMPAYLGGTQPLAGIKWIASFPGNIVKNKARASSITVLNDVETGYPLCIINSALISAIRTAAVTGLVTREYLKYKQDQTFMVGISGLGPIGRMHLSMIECLLGNKIEKLLLYDTRPVQIDSLQSRHNDKITLCNSWQEAYKDADIFITCTVADQPYIDVMPKKGSLQLNISLRDYKASMRKFMDVVIVDNWEEVCRENTDIEHMHKSCGLQKEDTFTLSHLIEGSIPSFGNGSVSMFNPMGMAIFDIAVAGSYYQKAISQNVGIQLPDQ